MTGLTAGQRRAGGGSSRYTLDTCIYLHCRGGLRDAVDVSERLLSGKSQISLTSAPSILIKETENIFVA